MANLDIKTPENLKKQAAELLNQGKLLERGGDHDKARLLYLQAYELEPKNVDIIHSLGNLYLAQKNNTQSLYWGRLGESLASHDARFWRIIGYTLKRQKLYTEALSYIIKYRSATPDDPAIVCQQAETMYRLNQFADTLTLINQERAKGNNDERLCLFEMESLISLTKYAEAIAVGEASLVRVPAQEFLGPILAKCYFLTHQMDKARACLFKHLDFFPDSISAWSFLATIAGETDDTDLLLQASTQIKRIEPQAIEGYVNQGAGLLRMGRYSNTRDLLLEAIKAHPNHANAHYNLCSAYNYTNDLTNALIEYEWWWQTDQPAMRPPQNVKIWHGEDLNGKSLNVFFDQGVGDSVQFSRFVRLAIEKYPQATITMTAEKKLAQIIRALMPDSIRVLDRQDVLDNGLQGRVDYLIPICSMPSSLDVWTWDDLMKVPPIAAQPFTPRNYKTPDKPFVVGISWKSIAARSYYYRCVDLLDFSFLAGHKNVRVIDLQYGDTSADLKDAAAQGFNVDHDDSVNSWENLKDFAEQVLGCDLIISIDNSTVHIAGTLGVPCWVLLPGQSHWRWHKNIDWTPWYPSLRLYRAEITEKLNVLMPQVAQDFAQYLTDRNALPAPVKTLPALDPRPTTFILGNSSDHGSFAEQIASNAIVDMITQQDQQITTGGWYDLHLSNPQAITLTQFDDDQIWSDMRSRNPSLFWKLHRADNVILEAGNNLIGTGPDAINLLYVAYNAVKRMGKKVNLVGGDIFPELRLYPENAASLAWYRKVLPLLESCATTHPVSQEVVSAVGGKSAAIDDQVLVKYLAAQRAQKTTAQHDTSPLVIITPSVADSIEQVGAQTRLISLLATNGYRMAYLGGASYNERTQYINWRRMMTIAAKDLQLDIPDLTPQTPDEWLAHLQTADVILSGSYPVSRIARALDKKHLVYGDACFRNTLYASDSGQTHKTKSSDPDFAKSLLIAVVKALR